MTALVADALELVDVVIENGICRYDDVCKTKTDLCVGCVTSLEALVELRTKIGYLAAQANGDARKETVVAVEHGREEDVRLFRVTEALLATNLAEWSEPVAFRMEPRDDGTYDLVLKRWLPS